MNTSGAIALVSLLALALTSCDAFRPPEDTYTIDEPLVLKKKIEMLGHRGARGLMPENTWPAFESGIRAGMTGLELDINETADHELVIHHDAFTNPARCRRDDGSRINSLPIARLKLADLKALDCGSLPNRQFSEQKQVPTARILTLEEFFARIKTFEAENASLSRIAFLIDVKFPPRFTPSDAHLQAYARMLVQKLRSARMAERSTVQSFELRLLPFMKELEPKLRTAALFASKRQWRARGKYVERVLERSETAGVDIIAPYHADITQDLVDAAHAKGFKIIPWTVNETARMRLLLYRGVDGIISDYPDRLAKVVAESSR